jgi:hypothetical protein
MTSHCRVPPPSDCMCEAQASFVALWLTIA